MISETQVLQTLCHVFDPELGVNIVDLGLIYSVEVQGNQVTVLMTMTTPACPLGSYLVDMAKVTLWQRLMEVEAVDVKLVCDPPWHPGLMSKQARQELNYLYSK